MDFLSKKYTLKEGSVKEPTEYLGNQVGKWDMYDPLNLGKQCWVMLSDLYVKRAVTEVEKELGEVHQQLQLPSKVSTPMLAGYQLEVDGTKLLSARQASYFQGLIRVLWWICEVGWIDILHDIAMLLRFLAAPREGHLEQCLHIFAFLKKYDHSKIIFDNSIPSFKEERFQQCDWEEFYPGADEVIPPNMHEAQGKPLTMTCFVDANHVGCWVTHRWHTLLNKAPVMWYSKHQNKVETSTFGSEFIAMKTAVEMIEGLRYKLRMMGI
jgi:hypothetical protein